MCSSEFRNGEIFWDEFLQNRDWNWPPWPRCSLFRSLQVFFAERSWYRLDHRVCLQLQCIQIKIWNRTKRNVIYNIVNLLCIKHTKSTFDVACATPASLSNRSVNKLLIASDFSPFCTLSEKYTIEIIQVYK